LLFCKSGSWYLAIRTWLARGTSSTAKDQESFAAKERGRRRTRSRLNAKCDVLNAKCREWKAARNTSWFSVDPAGKQSHWFCQRPRPEPLFPWYRPCPSHRHSAGSTYPQTLQANLQMRLLASRRTIRARLARTRISGGIPQPSRIRTFPHCGIPVPPLGSRVPVYRFSRCCPNRPNCQPRRA